MELYFAYGSNMSTPRLRARLADSRPLGRAFVDDWQLAFNKPGRDGTRKANLVPSVGARAWGVLFEIPRDAWSVLDAFEPGYTRHAFRFERPTREPLMAQAYVYSPAPTTALDAAPIPTPKTAQGSALPGAPSAAYLAHVLAGAREHALPESHIAWISSFLPSGREDNP